MLRTHKLGYFKSEPKAPPQSRPTTTSYGEGSNKPSPTASPAAERSFRPKRNISTTAKVAGRLILGGVAQNVDIAPAETQSWGEWTQRQIEDLSRAPRNEDIISTEDGSSQGTTLDPSSSSILNESSSTSSDDDSESQDEFLWLAKRRGSACSVDDGKASTVESPKSRAGVPAKGSFEPPQRRF